LLFQFCIGKNRRKILAEFRFFSVFMSGCNFCDLQRIDCCYSLSFHAIILSGHTLRPTGVIDCGNLHLSRNIAGSALTPLCSRISYNSLTLKFLISFITPLINWQYASSSDRIRVSPVFFNSCLSLYIAFQFPVVIFPDSNSFSK
jgi:hypothetical protein